LNFFAEDIRIKIWIGYLAGRESNHVFLKHRDILGKHPDVLGKYYCISGKY